MYIDKPNIRQKRILKQSHSAGKCERGTVSDFLTFLLLQNIEKLERGTCGRLRNTNEVI